jgi:hypothetical protein
MDYAIRSRVGDSAIIRHAMLVMRDRKKMSVFECALADSTAAAHSPERSIRHFPYRDSFLKLKSTRTHAHEIEASLPPRRRCVSCTSETGHADGRPARQVRATTRLSRCGKRHCYSMTSSARVSKAIDTLRPSALAVLRLMTNSNLVGACTGRSPGRSPLRIRST